MFKNIAYPIDFSAKKYWFIDLLKVLTGSVFIALMAQVSIHLPFTPVPVTGQTFAVLLVASLLTPKEALAAVLNYIFMGALGLPAFALGVGGAAVLMGPTAGYIFGFIFSTLLISNLFQRFQPKNILKISLTMWLGSIVVFSFGAFWLSYFVGNANAVSMGVLPFIPGDIIKILLAATSYKLIRGR